MAKQTFTTGQVLTAAQMTSLQQTAMLGGAANAKVASYVLVAADAGDAITMSNASPTTITVNTGLFAAGDTVTIINLGAGACTITAGTATVTTSGSLVLATNQGGVLRFTSASAAIFFQFATPASGDIEGVTAGTGISGGGTSGTVTITNSMATAIDAKGDLIVGTGADTFDKLSVGTNGHTLVADSSTATGLKWAAASAGGMTLLSTTTLSGASVTLNSFSGYNELVLIFRNYDPVNNGVTLRMQVNADSGANRHITHSTVGGAGPTSFNATNWLIIENQDPTTATGFAYLQIPDYANTTTWKAARGYAISNDYGTPTNFNSQNSAFYYNQTGAITSLLLFPLSGNFSSGTVLLYGVK